MKIKIRIVDKEFEYFIDRNDTVKKLKDLIEQKHDYKFRIERLNFNNHDLKDDRLLSDYEICDQSIINVFIAYKKFKVHISYIGTDDISLDVSDSDKILDLKRRISNQFRLPAEEQSMLYKKEILENERTLLSYNLKDGSCLTVIPVVSQPNKQIIIREGNNKVCCITCKNTDKIESIKQKVEEETGITGYDLCCDSRILHNNNIVKDIGIKDPMVSLTLVRKQGDNIQLLVKDGQGRTYETKVNKYDKCLSLKKEILNKTGVPIDEQFLTFNGVDLEDDKPLSHYHLANKSVVQLNIRLRGGDIFIF